MEQIAVSEVLRRYGWFVAIVGLVALFGGFGSSYFVTERYTASALVLVRPQEPIHLEQRSSVAQLSDFPVTQSMAVETPAKTYIEIIKSGALVGEVVQSLHLDQDSLDTTSILARLLGAERKRWMIQELKDTLAILKYGRVIRDDPFTAAVKEVQDNLLLASVEDTYTFTITYAGKSPDTAARIVNLIAQSFIEFMEVVRADEGRRLRDEFETKFDQSRNELRAARERLESLRQPGFNLRDLRLQESDVDAAQTAYDTVIKEFKEADINHAFPLPEVRLISGAAAPTTPSEPLRIKFAGIALIGGLIVGLIVAFLREYLNRRIRSVADVETFVGLKTLTTIPYVSSRVWRLPELPVESRSDRRR